MPENLDIANEYLQLGSAEAVAESLAIPKTEVSQILAKPEVKQYISQVYMDQGYRNKFRLGHLLDELIAQKLQEAEETGFYTKYDLLDLLKFSQTLRNDETKEREIQHQTNVQINEFGEGNYGKLMERLLANGSK